MSRFYYYLPSPTPIAQAQIEQYGLAYALDAGHMTQGAVGVGPDEKPGRVCAQGDDPRVGYHADRQTWRRMSPDPACAWIGWPTDDPPGPEDLIRDDPAPGLTLPLGDGRAWLVPAVVDRDGDCLLPKCRDVDPETGAIVKRPLARFDELRKLADLVRDAALAKGSVEDDEVGRVCLAALATNYRVGIHEAAALELLTPQAEQYICWALIGYGQWPEFQEMAAAAQEDA